jgi:SOS-response transcriptional repressor LexA
MKVALDHNMRVIDVTPPTPRQLEVLAVISRHMLDYGSPPSIREIGAQLGIGSPNGIMCHLRSLIRKGLLRRIVREERYTSFVPVVPPGCCPTCGQRLPEVP